MKHFYWKAMRISTLVIGIQIGLTGLLTALESNSQTLDLDFEEAGFIEIFQAIEDQVEVSFVYDAADLLGLPLITLKVKGKSLKTILRSIEKKAPVRFKQSGNLIGVTRVREKTPLKLPVEQIPEDALVQGTVNDQQGRAIPGVNILIKGTARGTTTNIQGRYSLEASSGDTLVFSYVGYKSTELPVGNRNSIDVVLEEDITSLDEVVINAGYYQTTEKLKTGSIGKITATEIASQPVSNPLATLQGRIPGLEVQQSNGVAGGAFRIRIRGQNALGTSSSSALTVNSDPLIVIDGVPYAPGNTNINTVGSTLGVLPGQGLSPFFSLNPADIESIEVLKDADATAIYGSRGGNGVVLITTKKGKAGKTRVNLNVSQGMRTVSNPVEMMNTAQYLEMRREAFANDGITPDENNAPDLTLFDQNRETDFIELLTGNTARFTDIQVGVSGGTERTQFLLQGGYNHESTPFSNELSASRASMLASLNHTSADERFNLIFSGSFSATQNNLVSSPFSSALRLPPNLPALRDENGDLNWDFDGVNFDNPLASLLQEYNAETENLISNLQLGYRLLPGLTLKANLGYNTINVDELNIHPIVSQNPLYSPLGFTNFGSNSFKSWIVEPQLQYNTQLGEGSLEVLLGGTWQQTDNKSSSIFAYGYSSDGLLGSLNAANLFFPQNSSYQYRYQAFFGRVNYNLKDKYLLNLTGRRDGSSRFGPDRQFANFGALGAAWVFSEEDLVKSTSPFLSFGKLRASYGITGTDQIGNYQYLDSWQSAGNPYDGIPGLRPSRLANPDYSWEENRKLEVALELGFLENRIEVIGAWYRNRSDNHLVQYALPSQTGFINITRNFPALIQNSGVEIELNTRNIQRPDFSWNTAFNISIPKNKLVSFPDLETSSYQTAYVEGESLTVRRGYEFLGVDPQTGIFAFNDRNQDGQLTDEDRIVFGDLDPDYFGGITNVLQYKDLTVSFFFQFVKQQGMNYLEAAYSHVPGTMLNFPSALLNRWQQPGDITGIQKFTADPSSEAAQAANLFQQLHSGLISNASFVRLKNVHISYRLPEAWLQKAGLSTARVYLEGQNLLTITPYELGDPETQNLYTLPPLTTVLFGIELSL